MATPCHAPKGVFSGVNFMTPNIQRHFKLREGYAELSTGTGMYQEPIFGVTVRKHDGSHFSPERSKLFHSMASAMEYIEELS